MFQWYGRQDQLSPNLNTCLCPESHVFTRPTPCQLCRYCRVCNDTSLPLRMLRCSRGRCMDPAMSHQEDDWPGLMHGAVHRICGVAVPSVWCLQVQNLRSHKPVFAWQGCLLACALAGQTLARSLLAPVVACHVRCLTWEHQIRRIESAC